MLKTLWLGFRSVLFYIGYVGSLVVHATLSVLLGVFMPIMTRFRFFLLWNRFIMWWLKVTCGVKVRVQGMENYPGAPLVILSNHQSTWETLYLIFHFMPVSAILKAELLNIPFFGWGLRMLQPIAIDRSKKREAHSAVFSQGRARLAAGISVLIFPEGTRVDPGVLKKFSSGGAELALQAGVPLLPVAHNAGHHWPARRFLKYPGTIDLIVGKPLATEGRSAKELTQEAEDWIRQAIKQDA